MCVACGYGRIPLFPCLLCVCCSQQSVLLRVLEALELCPEYWRPVWEVLGGRVQFDLGGLSFCRVVVMSEVLLSSFVKVKMGSWVGQWFLHLHAMAVREAGIQACLCKYIFCSSSSCSLLLLLSCFGAEGIRKLARQIKGSYPPSAYLVSIQFWPSQEEARQLDQGHQGDWGDGCPGRKGWGAGACSAWDGSVGGDWEVQPGSLQHGGIIRGKGHKRKRMGKTLSLWGCRSAAKAMWELMSTAGHFGPFPTIFLLLCLGIPCASFVCNITPFQCVIC